GERAAHTDKGARQGVGLDPPRHGQVVSHHDPCGCCHPACGELLHGVSPLVSDTALLASLARRLLTVLAVVILCCPILLPGTAPRRRGGCSSPGSAGMEASRAVLRPGNGWQWPGRHRAVSRGCGEVLAQQGIRTTIGVA